MSNVAQPKLLDVKGLGAGTYNSQNTLLLTAKFSENVNHIVIPDDGLPMLVLGLDSGNAYAQYANHSGNEIAFTYQPSFTDFTNGTVQIVDFAQLEFSQADESIIKPIIEEKIQLDNIIIQHSNVAELPAPKVYFPGDNLEFKLRWGGVSALTMTRGTPQLSVTLGTQQHLLNSTINNQGELVFTYEVTNQDTGFDKIIVHKLLTNNVTLVGVLNKKFDINSTNHSVEITNAQFEYSGLYSASHPTQIGLSDTPKIINITQESIENAQAGDTITFTADFSGNVTVNGSPNLTITINGQQYTATYVSGSESTQLTFELTLPIALVSSKDIAFSAIDTSNGSLTSDLGDAVNVELDNLNSTTGNVQSIVLATNAPEIVNSSFDININLAVADTTFSQDNLDVINGDITAFSGDGLTYKATITPIEDGQVTVSDKKTLIASSDVNQSILTRLYDGTAPTMSASYPADQQKEITSQNTSLYLEFDEAIVFSELDAPNIIVQQVLADDSEVNTPHISTINEDTINIAFSNNLVPDGQYQIILSANSVLDKAGNSFNTEAHQINFITANIQPIANPDVISTQEDHSILINVVDNDSDIENYLDITSVNVLSNPSLGALTLDKNQGQLLYLPNNNLTGQDVFSYSIADLQGKTSEPTSVNVQIADVNDPPALNTNNKTIELLTGAQFSLPLTISDVDSEEHTLSIVSGPEWLSIDLNNNLMGTVPNNELGSRSVTFSVSDGIDSTLQSLDLTLVAIKTQLDDLNIAWNKQAGLTNQPMQLSIEPKNAALSTQYKLEISFDTLASVINWSDTCQQIENHRLSCTMSGTNKSNVTLLPLASGQLITHINVYQAEQTTLIAQVRKDISIANQILQTATNSILTDSKVTAIVNAELNDKHTGLETVLATQSGENVKIVNIETNTLISAINNTGESISPLISDIDQDGLQDIIIVNKWGEQSGYYKNNGNSTFTQIKSFELATAAVLRDINNDLQPDLVLLTNTELSVYLNDSGQFNQKLTLPLGEQVSSFDIGDINGDKSADLVFVRQQQSFIIFGLFDKLTPVSANDSNNDSQLATAANGVSEQLISDSVSAIVLADLNLDGNHDIIIANNMVANNMVANNVPDSDEAIDELQAVSLFSYNNNDKAFSQLGSFGDSQVTKLNAAKFDQDDAIDIALLYASGAYQVFLNENAGKQFEATQELIIQSSSVVNTSDNNQDSITDIISYNSRLSQLDVFAGQGSGLFATSQNNIDLAINLQTEIVIPANGAEQHLAVTLQNNSAYDANDLQLVYSNTNDINISSNGVCSVSDEGANVCSLGVLPAEQEIQLDLYLSSMSSLPSSITLVARALEIDNSLENNSLTTAVTINTPPTANNDSYTVNSNETTTLDVLKNDADIDVSDTLNLTSASSTNGSVSIMANNQISFKPNDGFSGDVVIDYEISDSFGNTSNAQANVQVTNTNNASGGSIPLSFIISFILLLLSRRSIKFSGLKQQ